MKPCDTRLSPETTRREKPRERSLTDSPSRKPGDLGSTADGGGAAARSLPLRWSSWEPMAAAFTSVVAERALIGEW